MAVYWYAMQSKPNKEEALYGQLLSLGYEAFYPRIHAHPVNPRARKIKPYFPGYLFVHADLEQVGRSTLQYMPFSRGMVTFDWEPATVPDTLIQALQRRLGNTGVVEEDPASGFQKGETVLIQYGPFAGYEAIFDLRLSGSERVRVLIKLLSQRQVPVELHAAQIIKEPAAKRSPESSHQGNSAPEKNAPGKKSPGKRPSHGDAQAGGHGKHN